MNVFVLIIALMLADGTAETIVFEPYETQEQCVGVLEQTLSEYSELIAGLGTGGTAVMIGCAEATTTEE